jgi:hypothetical protein
MKIIPVALIVLSLTGCAGMKDKYCDYKVIPPAEPMEIDPRVLESCKDLIIPDKPLDWDILLENTRKNKLIYLDCVKRQENSIKLIKKFSNNK